jgi:predicted O-linked N-acetylglucosamine transferase (SPINDLY family)
MPELVTQTKEEYVGVAVGLAGDLGRLGAMRGELRERMRGSRLMDEKGFVGSMEGAYRGMWREWCGGKMQNSEGRIQN